MVSSLVLLLACFFHSHSASAQPATGRAPSEIVFPAPAYETSFIWDGRTGNRRDEHMALLIPVTLASSRKVVYMQFDTGSPVSLLYRDQLNSVLAADTTQPINELALRLGGQPIVLKKPAIVRQGTVPKTSSAAPLIVGTFGTDLLSQHVVQIDFPKRKLMMMAELPASADRPVAWSTLLYERGNILLPARIRGKSTLLYWDSGSSSFSLLTDQTTWSGMAAADSVDRSYAVQSWGKQLTAHTIATHDSIELGKQTLPIRYVSYMEGASDSQINRMLALGIGGLTGNALFLQSVLLIDTRNRRYGFLDN